MSHIEKLTRFEKTRLLSARMLQLSLGAPFFAETKKSTSLDEIAHLELEQGVLPLSVLREYPDGSIKRVQVNKN